MRSSDAFHDCKWCHGNGCLYCDQERKKAEAEGPKPLFTAKIPEDLDLLKEALGAEAIQKAFATVLRGPEDRKP